MKIRVRVPQFEDLKTAIVLYHSRVELSNADIKKLFGAHCNNTISKLKALAREKMAENNVPAWNPQHVNTAAAYEAWGLDIEDLERRFEKIKNMEVQS